MTQLIQYDAIRQAIAVAQSIEEVKNLRDMTLAFEAFAKKAKDRSLIEQATDIKMRAERRAGELLREMPKNPGAKGIGPIAVDTHDHNQGPPKLADLNITKDESSRWQKLAAMPEAQFEEKLAGVKSDMRAKTEGRQKPKVSKPRNPAYTPAALKEAASLVLDKSMSQKKAAEITGLGIQEVKIGLAAERAIREAPPIDATTLSITAQQKLELALKQHKAKLDAIFHQEVNARVQKFLMETILPKHRVEQKEAKRIVDARKGVMDKATFNAVRRALHPDSRKSISDKMLGEAFDAFMALEKRLLNEKDSPTDFQDLPNTWQEWEEARRKTTQSRKTKRSSQSVGLRQ